MQNKWDFQLIQAKYHFQITKKLFEDFKNYEEKRLLIGIINELAISTSHIINSYLIYSMIKNKTKISKNNNKRLKDFQEISKKHLTLNTTLDLLEIIEVKRMQKNSAIQFFKKNKLILLKKTTYKTISIKELNKLKNSLDKAIKEFPKD